jgi:hypothetical protein
MLAARFGFPYLPARRIGNLSSIDLELVADPANGPQPIRLRPKRLAQRYNVDLERVLLDGHAGPDRVKQLVLGDDLATGLGQHRKDVERALADRLAPAVNQQLPPWLKRSRSEPNFV